MSDTYVPRPNRIDPRLDGHWRLGGWLAVCLVILTADFRRAMAQEAEAAVEAGKEAISEAADFPWYDSSNDSVQRIDVKPRKDIDNRHSKWQTKLPDFSLPAWLVQLLKVLMWALIAVVFGFLIYLLVRAVVSYEEGMRGTAPGGVRTVAGEIDRVESLPFQLKRPQTNLLEEARRLYEVGEYGEAVVYLYSYQLIQLDQNHLIRLTRGKTNRQYLREIRRRPNVHGLLERTMIAFEDFFFGNHSIDRRRFESCWNALDDFHQQVRQATV
jgi:hypothetical protein